jgi:hypothetical protein
MEKFTPEFIAGIVSVLLTVIFAYFPKLRVAFAGLASEAKSGIMLGLYLLSTVVIFMLGLYGYIPVEVPLNWFDAVMIFFSLVIVGQPTYNVLPEVKDVRDAKMERDYAIVESAFGE